MRITRTYYILCQKEKKADAFFTVSSVFSITVIIDISVIHRLIIWVSEWHIQRLEYHNQSIVLFLFENKSIAHPIIK